MNGNKYACKKQAVRQDLHRQTETEDALEHAWKLIEPMRSESKHEAETAGISRSNKESECEADGSFWNGQWTLLYFQSTLVGI